MRPDILKPLFDPSAALKGVGDTTRHALTRLGCERVKDLLFHLPAHYLDRRYAPALYEAIPGKVATFRVTVESHQPPARGSKAPYKVVCGNETGSLQLLYFKGNAATVKSMLIVGRHYVISGKTDRFDGLLQMAHPDIVAPPDQWDAVCRLEPQYPLTYALSNRVLAKLVQMALARIPVLPEWIDAAFKERRKWPGWAQTLRILHAPADDAPETIEPLRTRLAYDEILAGQLALAMVRRNAKAKPGIPMPPGPLREKALKQLPFQLTAGQRQVLAEIDADLASGERMMRLLQGDVGSGKTALALLAMLSAVDHGFQAAIMAPTEILARQHLHWLESQLLPLGVQIGILTGREKGKKREELLARLANGQLQIVIGTHALFQDDVVFHNLGLVVVDEQHRFGVMQRLKLGDKGRHPHVLMMTATPIPRSLTLAAFGDMDCSRLTEKPPGRKPVDTRAVPSSRMDDVVDGLRRLLDTGGKAYWVCPLVEESEEIDLAAVEARYRLFAELFGKEKVGLVHGRLKSEEKEAALRRFALSSPSPLAGEGWGGGGGRDDPYPFGTPHPNPPPQGGRESGKLLVATTVVEVGVNVPDATVMVIEHAERFGLAQLHQLRGRVGRGEKPSSCILLYADSIGETGKERLKAIRASEDGFQLAEDDLRIRGGGDLLGTRQSGLPEWRFADLAAHQELIRIAHDDVKLILNKDAPLASERGKALRILLYLHDYDTLIRTLEAG